MARTLLSLGASCAQADRDGATALERLVQESASPLIGLLVEADKVGIQSSINHISITSALSISWPLQRAIKQCNAEVAIQLLDAGASPEIDFDTFLKAAKHQPRHVFAFLPHISLSHSFGL